MSLQEFSGPLNGNCDHKMSRKKAANLALTGIEPYDGHPKKEQETSPWPRWAPKSYKWDYKGKFCTPFITGKGPPGCRKKLPPFHPPYAPWDWRHSMEWSGHQPRASRSLPPCNSVPPKTAPCIPGDHGSNAARLDAPLGTALSMAPASADLLLFLKRRCSPSAKHAQRQKDKASRILRCFFWRHKWTKMWFS